MKIDSKKLKEQMKRQGLKQWQVAALVNLTPAAISILLKRKTSRIATINKIAKVLGLDAKDLMV